MKKFILITGLVLVTLVLTSAVIRPGIISSDNLLAAKDSVLPADVHKIVSNSCFACHGNDGKAIALSHVKMEQWGGYSAEKQAQKAEEMCNMITKMKMPPKGYLKDHPEAALTSEQIDIICKWSDSLK